MAWGSAWDNDDGEVTILPPATVKEETTIKKLKKRYTKCVNWEAEARNRFDYDYKFANGDSHNKYQWDQDLINAREDRPCLTVNKTQQHNLLVINDAKQNKPGVRIRPVSDEASFDGAEVFQELIYHTEYISNAETVYDSATTFQVEAGIGYWRIVTDWVDDGSFDQEIYIRHIKDPRSVYLDPDINEVDGSDARFGIIFEDMPNDIFKEEYPKFAYLAGSASTLGNDGWLNKDDIRIAEYYYKEEKQDKLVTWTTQDGAQVLSKLSDLKDDTQLMMYKELKKLPVDARATYQFRERNVVTDSITWCKIAGDRIIKTEPWLGKYIPIVRLVGTETVIDGILDRKGHTRALINAQQIYNYNTSSNVEYGALQTKSPWLAPSAAITNFEEYYATANTANHSYLPYNHMDEDGNVIPPPSRPPPPQPGTAYTEGLKIAANEMMMASGQWQSQVGENENAKSGVAINARQRQGDRATYHFLDNQAIAIRFTGKILIDLYPKVYDTKRVKQILARDGTKMNVQIDPQAPNATQDLPTLNADKDHSQQIEQIIFNPTIGTYDVRADTGPSFATRRMEAFSALTQVAATDKNFMSVAGDLYFKVADFPEADILAERYRRMIPPNILGDTPNPQQEQIMHQASDKIQQLTAMIGDLTKKLADRDKEFDIKSAELELKGKEASVEQQRLDYDAETKRLVALGNSGPSVSVSQIQPVVAQLLKGMLNAHEPGSGDRIGEHGIDTLAAEQQALQGGNEPEGVSGEDDGEAPPIPGARKALDGKFYVKIGGQHHRIEAAQ
jgi:Phage P22-like portal protein